MDELLAIKCSTQQEEESEQQNARDRRIIPGMRRARGWTLRPARRHCGLPATGSTFRTATFSALLCSSALQRVYGALMWLSGSTRRPHLCRGDM
ncbi:unnamed protein product [Gadus morhua 'NCC']